VSPFDALGKPLTLKSYGKLESGEKAGITHDTENWEGWSTPYDFAAGQGELRGAKPRRYLQFKADFASTQAAGGRLAYVEFAVSKPPVASAVLAEIVPAVVPTGQVTHFTYKLRPRLNADDLGFDSMAIDTPARPVGVDSVRVGGQAVDFVVTRLDEHGLAVQLPRVGAQQTEELVEVVFRAEVFRFGTIFTGWVWDSTRPHEVHQRVTEGDADELVDSNTLSVGLTALGQETIQALRRWPAAFTPNGDGVNDVVRLEYDLLNLEGSVPVVIGVYDLAGRQVAEAGRGVAASGRYTASWDGRDSRGAVLPPGVYLLRLEVQADQHHSVAHQLVSLVH
jgi:hypothetical protein